MYRMVTMNNRMCARFFCLLIALTLLITGWALAERGLENDVVVLFTSDVHCGVDQGFGYAGLAAIRDAMEAEGNHVVLVDNGDSIQGEPIGLLSEGEAIIEMMNQIDYDVAIPGNHEFDYGMERFLELTEMAGFPYVSCNFNHEGELVFEPYVMREFDGVNVAFVGVTTPETLYTSTPRYFQDDDGNFIYGFMQSGDGAVLYDAVQKSVDDARSKGADYVILLAHLGNAAASSPYTYADVIENTRGIDALLDGHSHDTDRVVVKNRDGKAVVRQACGTKLGGIGWLRISAADGGVDTGLYTWNNDISAPSLLGIRNEMASTVGEALETLDSTLDQVIGTSYVNLTINDPVVVDDSGAPVRIIRNAETNLGDLVADAFLAQSGADVAVVCGGNIRKSIPRGDITMKDMLITLPFGMRIYTVEVTGQQILDALEWGARNVPGENGAFLQVAGMSYEIHTYIENSCREDENGFFTDVEGEYRVRNVLINSEPLELDRLYKLVSIDYTLLDHGDGYTSFDGARIVWEADVMDYQMVANYIQENLNGIVGEDYENPYGQERIVAVEAPVD